jgi:Protein of unknown function (DUF1761)
MGTGIFSHLNWLAILVAAIAYFILGAIWYSFLFRNSWIRLTGVNMNDPNGKKGVGGIMFTSFLLILLSTIGIALFLSKANVPLSWMSGARVGLVAGVCFSAAAISNSYLYEKRPFGLHLVNGGYNVVGSIIAGIVLAMWP